MLKASKTGLKSVVAICAALLGGCGADARVVDDTAESNAMEPAGNPMREGPAGCYIGAERRCDCALMEADCTDAMGGTWVDEGCASCTE